MKKLIYLSAIPALAFMLNCGGQKVECKTKARDLKGKSSEIGASIKVSCPSSCTRNSVWGTEKYTSDSSVCTAAVHSGVISADKGGKVTVNIVGSNPSYKGSEKNGVKSRDWSNSWGKTAFTVK